jgi:PAS domain S-box-containing protein
MPPSEQHQSASLCDDPDGDRCAGVRTLSAAFADLCADARRTEDPFMLGCLVTRGLVGTQGILAAWLGCVEEGSARSGDDSSPRMVRPIAQAGLGDRLPGPFRADEEQDHLVARAVRASDVVRRPLEDGDTGLPGLAADDARLALAFGLRNAERVHSVLIVLRDGSPFPAADQTLLFALAEVIAVRLEQMDTIAALSLAEDHFEILVKNVPGVVYLCNNDARYTMLFLSEAVEQLTGHAADEFLADRISFVELYHPEDSARIAPVVDAALEARKPFLLNYRLACKGGGWRWVEEYGQGVFDAAGTLLYLEGILLDVSQRVRAQEEHERLQLQLLQAQKLESLGVLAGGIAHDFNNLLTGVLGMSTLALADLPKQHPAHDAVQQAIDAAERAARLTVQLLAYSGKGSFQIDAVDLSTQVQEITELIESSIPKKVRVERALASDLPAIEADASQLQQLVMNLVLNAAESFLGDPGVIRISTGSEDLAAPHVGRLLPAEDRPPGLYVYLRVEDRGVGMSQATVDRIFDPFFTTKDTGRGLGLAAVLGIARSHGGGLEIRTAPGQGSTFTAYLPTCTTEIPMDQTSEPIGDLFGNGTVLVVDDELLVRNLVTSVLIRQGYRVICAENGRRGVDVFEEQGDEIDAVLLDMTMPEMDGAETFVALRAIDPGIRVVLTSGYTELSASERFADGQRPNGFLEKPYTASQLATAIREAIFSEPPRIVDR